MSATPLQLRLWFLVACAAAASYAAFRLCAIQSLTSGELAVAAALLIVLTSIERMDITIPISSTTLRVSVGASVALASAMFLGPWFGCVVVFIGHLIDSLLARRDPVKSITNVAINVATTALSGLLYQATSNADISPVGSTQNIAASLGASTVHVVVSTLLMAMIVAPIIGMPFRTFLQSASRLLVIEGVTMPAVSGLMVLAAKESAAAVVLIVFPLLGPQVAYRTLIRAQRSVRATLESLADILEQRDPYTANHSMRVASYVRAILHEMPDVPYELTETIVDAARVHDIGKVGARDVTLFKPGPLTTEERRDFQHHTAIGSDILSNTDEYRLTALIVRHHHENWNGTGYPDRLVGHDIPLGSRVIAVADAFDAMTTDRPYRTAMPRAAAIEEIRRHSGTQFDPQVVAAFLRSVGAGGDGTVQPFRVPEQVAS